MPAKPAAWLAGWRVVGDQRIYFRSRWEANYARYLQTLVERGEIIGWKHEPETFWFHEIKRGVNSYKPDFKVYLNDGSHEWHEVKGRIDHRSQLTIKRMRRYYIEEPLIVFDEEQYRDLESRQAQHIPGWEFAGDPMAASTKGHTFVGRRLR